MTALYMIDAGLDPFRSFAGETGNVFALIAWIFILGQNLTGEGTEENQNTGKEEILK